jgi:hypothetical protein
VFVREICQYKSTLEGIHRQRGCEEIGGGLGTHSLLHVGDDLFRLGDLLARDIVILGRMQRCKLDLLALKLELGALDGRLELLGRLVT